MNHLKRAFSCAEFLRLRKSASGAPIILCTASRREKLMIYIILDRMPPPPPTPHRINIYHFENIYVCIFNYSSPTFQTHSILLLFFS